MGTTIAGGEEFRILSVKCESPEVRIESLYGTSEEAASQRVTLKAAKCKDSKRHYLTGLIQVNTTAKVQPIVEIRWSATLDRSLGLRAKAARSGSRSERKF